MAEGDRLLTVPEVAERLRAKPATVRRWLREGRIKGMLPGGDRFGWRIPESEVARFISEGMRSTEREAPTP